MPPATQQESQPSGETGQGGSPGGWKDREPPPPYDGRNPDKTFSKWLKEIKLWEYETEVPKNKWGAKLLRQLSGTARAAAEGLTFEEIACEKGMENVMKVLKEHFAPHLETSLPKAMEAAIYGDVRSARKGFAEYVIRMEHAFKELEREGVTFPPIAAGYVIYRHANLTEVQDNQMITWCEGKYDKPTIIKNLRKLEMVVHEKKWGIFFGEEDEEGQAPDGEFGNEAFPVDVDVEYESDEDDDYVYINAGKGAGGAPGRGKGRPTFAPRSREKVRFNGGKGGSASKVHIDQLKLRTRCARCGCIGHWAKECRGVPDARGRQHLESQRSSAAPTTSSTRSGFFVTGQSPGGAASFFGKVVENGEQPEPDASYVPLFDQVMNAVCRRRSSSRTTESDQDRGQSAESFVGAVTSSKQGVIDTAAQDGLIGKPAMLRLVDSLRERGLGIRWTGKRAQATGVGGRATVIGVIEAPMGIAGVNGLVEMTVVQEDIPLLLPIKLLRQLRAIVDLDEQMLVLKKFGTKASLCDLPSGHIAVDVMAFAPEGWSLP
ncbi:Ank2 [Symbiodinium sp. CCMP2592]|nr:Ank2 [Symbiodinium sp. CCMP2592]